MGDYSIGGAFAEFNIVWTIDSSNKKCVNLIYESVAHAKYFHLLNVLFSHSERVSFHGTYVLKGIVITYKIFILYNE